MPFDENEIFLDWKRPMEQGSGKLPHLFQFGKMQFITFRLADSLPQPIIEELKRRLSLINACRQNPKSESHPQQYLEENKDYQQFLMTLDKYLDAGHGECILKNEELRQIVTDAILWYDEKSYFLDSFVVMPNHVHIMAECYEKPEVFVENIKRYTARKINKTLGMNGRVWQKNFYDRMPRNYDMYFGEVDYIRGHIGQVPPSWMTFYEKKN